MFHEIGHLLLHGKRELNIDFENGLNEKSEKELKANEFASEVLIPSKDFDEFLEGNCYTMECIKKFSEKEKIDTGIVIGRLEHFGKIPFSRYARLKDRFEWAEDK